MHQQIRDAKAEELGATGWRVGINWSFVHGFPTETLASQYAEHIRITEKRERVHTEKEQDGTYTVAIHF
jgi:hypothetical protein